MEQLLDLKRIPLGNLALELTVGLPEGTDLLSGGRDLDNYLFPVAHRLGSNRLISVWAEKRIGESSLRLEAARSIDPTSLESVGWSHVRVRTTSSASTTAWKQEVSSQLLKVPTAPEGPLELQLSFLVGANRNWINLSFGTEKKQSVRRPALSCASNHRP